MIGLGRAKARSRRAAAALAVVGALALVGCVESSAVRLGGTEGLLPPSDPASVAVFRSPLDVGRPYREVGMIDASGDVVWTSEANVVAEMKRRAGRLGANGLIVEQSVQPGGIERVLFAIVDAGVPRYATGVAIMIDGLPVVAAPTKADKQRPREPIALD